MFANTNILGIAFGERVMTLAEVGPSRSARGRWEVRRMAEFTPPEAAGAAAAATSSAPAAGANRRRPDASGAALAEFLRANGFTASRAVLGVPAKWVVGREKELPPATAEQAAEVLRLQAERMFSSELGELAVDYAGAPDLASPRHVLLVAMPRLQLERIVRIAEAAGQRVLAVMPSTLALADASGPAPGASPADGVLLNLTPEAVELSVRTGGVPRLLRHLPVRGPDLASRNGTRASAVAALAGEVRRTLAVAPRGPSAGPRPLRLWDAVGLAAGDASALANLAGVEPLPPADLSPANTLVIAPGADALPAAGAQAGGDARYAPALALAFAGAARQASQLDFLHPKLVPPRAKRIGWRGLWAALAAVALALLLGGLWYHVRRDEAELASLRGRIEEMRPRVKAAAATADNLRAARGWFDARPPVLDPLLELTRAFPDAEPVYVVSVTLREGGKLQVNGKAPDDRSVLDLMDRLKGGEKFADVKLIDSRDAGGDSREKSFVLSLVFKESAATQAALGAGAGGMKNDETRMTNK